MVLIVLVFLCPGWSVLRTGAAAVWGATTEIVKDIQTTVAYVTWILFFFFSLLAMRGRSCTCAWGLGASWAVLVEGVSAASDFSWGCYGCCDVTCRAPLDEEPPTLYKRDNAGVRSPVKLE